MDVPVDDRLIEALEAIPDFRRAYEPDGLAIAEFDGYGATARTLRGFIKAYHDLVGEIRDIVLPNPDAETGRAGQLTGLIIPLHVTRNPITEAPAMTIEAPRSEATDAVRSPSSATGSTAARSRSCPSRPDRSSTPPPARSSPACRAAAPPRSMPRSPRRRRPSRPGATRRSSPAARSSSPIRELVWRHREELAALITRDHGKTFPDALGEVLRGLETVEFACGLPVHLAGLNTPNVVDQGRRPHAPPAARRRGRRSRRSTSR